jgi:hypothetical protein
MVLKMRTALSSQRFLTRSLLEDKIQKDNRKQEATNGWNYSIKLRERETLIEKTWIRMRLSYKRILMNSLSSQTLTRELATRHREEHLHKLEEKKLECQVTQDQEARQEKDPNQHQ